jgi:hypothetical protein
MGSYCLGTKKYIIFEDALHLFLALVALGVWTGNNPTL